MLSGTGSLSSPWLPLVLDIYVTLALAILQHSHRNAYVGHEASQLTLILIFLRYILIFLSFTCISFRNLIYQSTLGWFFFYYCPDATRLFENKRGYLSIISSPFLSVFQELNMTDKTLKAHADKICLSDTEERHKGQERVKVN